VTTKQRLVHWGHIMGRMSVIQLVIQGVIAATGLLLVRLLSKQEYALFTIAASAQAMLNLLTDSGINSGLMSIGGQVWQDSARLSAVTRTALRLRARLTIIGTLAVGPIAIWLLLTNGASLLNALAITAIVVAGTSYLVANAIYAGVLKLHSRYWTLQSADLAGALSRLGFCLLAVLVFLNATVAASCTALSQAVQYVWVRRKASEIVTTTQEEVPEDRQQLARMIKRQAPYFVFYSLQGQLSIFLISTFGTTSKVADIGALSRLGILAAVYNSVINYIVCPAFARARERGKLLRSFFEVLGVALLFGTVAIWLAWLFADQILWLFGPNYLHLRTEVVWMVVSLALGLLLGVIWGINTARSWINSSWLIIPLTLLVQIALVRWLQLSTVQGIIVFAIVSQLPNLLVSIGMTVRGFWYFRADEIAKP
jgi:O-antigen/teichoic acid export membrane protein